MKTPFLSILFLMFAVAGLNAQSMAPMRIGDTIELHVSNIPADDQGTFNAPVTIDDNGMINVPYINQVKVAGLLPNQIQELLQNRFKEEKIYTHPTVTIVMNQARFVNVVGEVKGPQRINFTADMTLMTAINACSGFSDYADQKHIRLIRDGKTTVYDAKQIRKDPSTDPKVLPGDQIQVPQSWW